jgi:hypothetical protein
VNLHSSLLAVAVAPVLALAGSATAEAATRYAGPASTVTSGACANHDVPCRIDHAINNAAANDEIVVLGGTYNVTPLALLTVTKRLDIRGEDGPRPILSRTNNSVDVLSLDAGSGGTTMRHLDLRASGTASIPLAADEQVSARDLAASGKTNCAVLNGNGSVLEDSTLTQVATPGNTSCVYVGGAGAVVRRVHADGDAEYPTLDVLSPNATVEDVTATNVHVDGGPLRIVGASGAPVTARRIKVVGPRYGIEAASATVTDSLAWTTAAQGTAFVVQGSSIAQLRNVTAIATGPESTGVSVATSFDSSLRAQLIAKNSIFRGTKNDVRVSPDGTVGCPPICPGLPVYAGSATISHSSFRGSTDRVTDGGDNQSGDPLFVGEPDFHLQAGSPAIDAGTDDPLNGATDLDGNARRQGAAPDMGAYEATPSPVANGGGGGTSVPDTLVADGLAPTLGALAVTNKTFAVGSGATPVNARAKKGTTFRYTSNEAGTTTIVIERKTTGRRSGRRCVRQTRRNRKRRKCTLYVRAGAPLTRKAVAGANSVPFSGRIGRKALKVGSYRASTMVTDAAGNKSPAKTVAFKVVKR